MIIADGPKSDDMCGRIIWQQYRRQTSSDHLVGTFYALREGVAVLKQFYTQVSAVPPTNPDAQFFPYANSFKENNGDLMGFSYEMPLKVGVAPSESTAFLATTSDGRQVVVKFVERYGVNAHQELAKIGKAPALLYCGDVWPGDELASAGCRPRMMIVMEYIRGTPLQKSASEAVCEAVRAAIEHLHSMHMVHGDIRDVNIIIAEVKEGEESQVNEGSRVRLLDFDWAGKVKEARYPLQLTKGLFPDGSCDGGPILKKHDLDMWRKLSAV